jgi:hypothetical protein
MIMNDVLAYERLVQRVFQAILRQEFVRNVDVQNNVRLQGIATNHQIDLFWEFEVGGINYKTIIEAKDWNKPVSQGALMKFKAILDDLPGQPRGILVSRSGFQAGARRFASSNGIVLYELRKPTERDLRGRVRALDFTFVSYHPITSNIALVHDEKWRVSEAIKLGLREVPRLDLSLEPEEARLLNEFGDQIGTVKEITDSCYPEGVQELVPTRTRHEFNAPTFLDTGRSDFPRLKLTAVEATIAIESLTQEFGVDVNELVHCILKDAFTGTIRTVDHQFLNVTQVD